jgi:hypothetical protein
MRKIIAALAAAIVLATSSAGLAAERCRVAPGLAGQGRFAKCGSPGAIPAASYVRKCVREGKACRVGRKGARLAPSAAPTQQSVIKVVG